MIRFVMLTWLIVSFGFVVGSWLSMDLKMLAITSINLSVIISGLGIVDALWNRKP